MFPAKPFLNINSMNKYPQSAAPWSAVKSRMGFPDLVYDANKRLVCAMEPVDPRQPVSNTDLVTAAPLLQSAVLDALATLQRLQVETGIDPLDPSFQVTKQLKAALLASGASA